MSISKVKLIPIPTTLLSCLLITTIFILGGFGCNQNKTSVSGDSSTDQKFIQFTSSIKCDIDIDLYILD